MPLQSPTARDGDAGFIGFASRMNPVALPAGVLQLSENMRLDRGTAKTRKGARRLADEILPSSFPLTVPFQFEPVLPVPLDFNLAINPGGLLLLSSYEGGIFTSYVYRSPGWDNQEVIVLTGAATAYIYQDPFVGALTDHASNPLTDENGNVIQAINYAAGIPYPATSLSTRPTRSQWCRRLIGCICSARRAHRWKPSARSR